MPWSPPFCKPFYKQKHDMTLDAVSANTEAAIDPVRVARVQFALLAANMRRGVALTPVHVALFSWALMLQGSHEAAEGLALSCWIRSCVAVGADD